MILQRAYFWKSTLIISTGLIELHERLAGKLSNPKCTMKSTSNLGFAYHYLGKYEKAIKCYDHAMEIARKTKDRKCEGVLLGKKGNVYRVRGEVGISIRCYEKALTIANETNDRRNKGIWLGNLGISYRLKGNLKKAINSLEEALEIAREKKDEQNESRWLTNIGLVHRDHFKYLFSWDEIPGNDDERIIEFLKDELKIEWAKTENISKINDGKTIIVSNKEKSISLKLNDEKNKVNLKIDNVRIDEFTVKIENGKLNIYIFNMTKAIGYYGKALKIAQDIGDIRSEGFLFGEFGFAYGCLGEKVKAKKYFFKALEIAQYIKDRSNENKWFGGLGKIYHDLGEVKKAIEYYKRALKIAQEIGNERFEGREIVGKVRNLC